MRSSLGPVPLGSSDSPSEPRCPAGILPGPSCPASLWSEAGTAETPRRSGGRSAGRVLCRAAVPPFPSVSPRPASQLPQGISMLGFSFVCEGRPVSLPPCSQEELLRLWLGSLGCLLVPCPCFVSLGPWRYSLRRRSTAPQSRPGAPVATPSDLTFCSVQSALIPRPLSGCFLPLLTQPTILCPLSMASGP